MVLRFFGGGTGPGSEDREAGSKLPISATAAVATP